MSLPTTQMNKIVLVINSLQGGGAEKFVLTLGEAFFKLGFEVHIVQFDPKTEHRLCEDLHYHLVPFRQVKWAMKGKFRHFVFAKMVDRYIKKYIGKPVLLLVNLYRAYEIFYYSSLPNIVYIMHNQLSKKLQLSKLPSTQRDYYQKLYSKYPIVGVSQGVVDDYQQYFINHHSIKAILNPIDRDSIIKLADEFIPPINNYVVHVGSFKAQKGHEVLLKAYAKSSQTKPLVLVGQGKRKAEIIALIDELALQDKVYLVGFQVNPYPWLKHATGFVLSSHFEGFALVLAEALALGVPAISTDCPSGPNEILPKHNLVAVNDAAALSDKLEALMTCPERFLVSFNEQFLPINVAKQYLDFMQIN